MPNQLAKLLAQGLGGQSLIGFGALTLVRTTGGTRDPLALTGGNNPTTASYPCKGRQGVKRSAYWQFWQNAQLSGAQARTKFIGFTILGATLPDGIEPRAGDSIVHGGATYTIAADGVTDPTGIGAVFECMCRAAGG
ncbi:MAG: hypothetical protein AB7P60_20575 [Hyphomicrobiaceae bacterium]